MNLSLFFDPVSEELLGNVESSKSLLHQLYINTDGDLDYAHCDIVLFTICDYRGTALPDSLHESFREELYSLKALSKFKIADLGDLRPGDTREDTIERLKEVCVLLSQEKKITCVIGGGHDLELGQYLSFQDSDKVINMLTVDPYFDIEIDQKIKSRRQLDEILTYEPTCLDTYAHFGYQSYLVAKDDIGEFEKLNFIGVRLGDLRSKLRDFEPEIRNSDLITFDFKSLKYADSRGAVENLPFGLLPEEACQLTWYAGLSDQLTSFGVYDYYESKDVDNQSAKILATMIWYFFDGYYNRKDTRVFDSSDYLKYSVQINNSDEDLIFYKNIKSDKWWMQIIPARIVPCNLFDYQQALSGDFPDRWLNEIVRNS